MDFFCIQIIEGIEFLHGLTILHNDIKADNVMLYKNTINPIFFWGGGGKITSPFTFLLITFVLLNILSQNFMTFIIFI